MKGVVVSRVWMGIIGVEQTEQPMVWNPSTSTMKARPLPFSQCLVVAVVWSEYNPGPDTCTDKKCADAFGARYTSFCTFHSRTTDNPASPGYPHIP